VSVLLAHLFFLHLWTAHGQQLGVPGHHGHHWIDAYAQPPTAGCCHLAKYSNIIIAMLYVAVLTNVVMNIVTQATKNRYLAVIGGAT